MGTNTIPSASDGTPIPASDHNSIKEALGNDLVPRNTSGVATAVQGNLGTTTYPWLAFYFGLVASGLSIRENSGKIAFYVGGANVFEFDSGGLIDESVPLAAIAQPNYVESSNCGASVSITSSSFTDVTNLSVSITTIGRPVKLLLCSSGDDSNYGSYNGNGIDLYYASGNNTGQIKFLRGSTQISVNQYYYNSPGNGLHISGEEMIDYPSAGTYTYKVQALVFSGLGSISFHNMRLVAVEL
ncbi:MAG: hypothetical protein KDD61_09135 [Bdellovibrionales bacterium]|nr:hypothetical protein [Bdellovibrionales bacterium]